MHRDRWRENSAGTGFRALISVVRIVRMILQMTFGLTRLWMMASDVNGALGISLQSLLEHLVVGFDEF